MELTRLTVYVFGAVLALSLCGAVYYPYPEENITLIDRRHSGSGEFIELGYILPEKYDVILDLTDGDKVDGKIDMKIKCFKTIDVIHLHAEDMNITTVALTRATREDAPRKPFSYQTSYRYETVDVDLTWEMGAPENHFLRIKLKDTINEGQDYYIQVTYNFHYSKNNRGLGKSPLRDLYADESGFLTTNFHLVYARRVFPCFDVPWFETKIKFSLITKPSYQILTSVFIKTESHHHGLKRSNFTFAKVPTNEVHFIVFNPEKGMDVSSFLTRYHPRTTKWPKNEGWNMISDDMEVFWTEEMSIHMASPNTLTLYGSNQNVFPPTVLGQEYYDPSQYLTWDLETVKNSGLKEYPNAGDLLEMRPVSWGDLWLKDGLTTFYRFLYTTTMYPADKEKLMEIYTVSLLMKAMSKAIGNYAVQTPATQGNIDDVTSYKAAAFIRTLSMMVGEGNFISITNSFIRKNRGKQFNSLSYYKEFDSFLVRLKLKDDQNKLSDAFSSWVDEDMLGFQIILANRTDSELILSMENSIRRPIRAWVPFSHYVLNPRKNNYFKARTDVDFWWWKPYNGKFDNKRISLDKQTQCVYLNHNFFGYFRILYDNNAWKKLLSCLSNKEYTNKYPPLNKALLLNDAFFFSMHGKLNHKALFDLVEIYADEIDIVPWIALYENLQYVESLLRHHSKFALYQKFKRKLTKKFLEHVISTHGLDVKKDDSQVARSTRMLAVRIACETDIKPVVEKIELMFRNVSNNPVSILHRDLHFIVLCHGIEISGASVYQTIMSRYDGVTSVAAKQLIAESLGCSNDNKLIDRVLNLVGDEKSRLAANEKLKILQRLSKTEDKTLGKVLDFLDSHKRKMKEMIGDDGLRNLIETMSYRMVSSAKIQKFNSLIYYWKSNKVLSDTLDEAILQRIRYVLDMNTKWVENSDWIDWMEAYDKKTYSRHI